MLLLRLNGGFMKYCCFLYLWDSQATEHHYVVKDWPKRRFRSWEKQSYTSLVDPQLVFLPLLHMKLGFMQNCVRVFNKNSDGLNYLKQKFPKVRDAKLRKLLHDNYFELQLDFIQSPAKQSF
jgi:hypothetical protein